MNDCSTNRVKNCTITTLLRDLLTHHSRELEFKTFLIVIKRPACINDVRSAVTCHGHETALSHHRRTKFNLFWNFCFYFHFPIFFLSFSVALVRTDYFHSAVDVFYVDSFMLVVCSAAKGNGRKQNSRFIVAGQKLNYIWIIFISLEVWVKIRVKLIKRSSPEIIKSGEIS